MHPRAEEFRERVADTYGFDVDVHEFPEGTKTATDAAEAIGCEVSQIASSLVFSADEDVVVVVTSGANRVDETKVADLVDADRDGVSMADADLIKRTLGWSIGGVPPFCHETDAEVFVDETVVGFDVVWAAAGTPGAVFPIDPETLVELSGGTIADVAE